MKTKITRDAIPFGINEISIEVEYEGKKYSGCLTEINNEDEVENNEI